MASFRERYEAMFGKKDDFDPIKPSPVDTQAEELLDAAPSASPDPVSRKRSALPILPTSGSPVEEESGFLGSVGRQLGAGGVQVGEMVLGAGEYAARQFDITDGIVADTFYGGRRGLSEVREGILAGISEDDLQKAASEILTLDPNRTIWRGNPLEVAEAITYKFANALPATLVTLIPAARWARASSPGTAIAYMGASEGVMSTGGIANAITDEILSIPTEQLLQESPRFAELLEIHGGDADTARQELIREAQGAAPLVGGATVAAISSVAGRYFTPIFEKPGAALGSRAARGFAAEAPQEGSQGATEQLIQNYSAKVYDLDRQLSEGVAEASAQEALIGGGMGAGFAALAGERPTPPPVLDEGGQGVLPGFGPQQRDPDILPDELDQPSPEPPEDIQAQIQDLLDPSSPRTGVYIPPGQDPRTYAVPEGMVEMEDIDGQGGSLIVRDENVALDARARIAQGESRQRVIGSIVGAGAGKPTSPDSRVVQLVDEQGAVARESLVASQEEAETLAREWGPRAAILLPREAIERRQQLGAGPGDIQIQEHMFDNTARGTQGVVVPPPSPETPEQGTLPLTVGRERGIGRVPIPEVEDVERPAALPDDATPEEGVDPYEVSRRQDDLFEGAAPYEPTIEEEVRQDIRSNIPFEERSEPIAAVEGVRSLGQAADRLIGRAAEVRQEEEQRDRIGGFYNPSRLTFEDADYQQAYEEAWSQLVEAELTIEMSNQKRAVERAKKRRQRLFQELGEIRQIAKPKLSGGRAATLIKAAEAVNPAEVRETRRRLLDRGGDDGAPREFGTATAQREVEEDFLGEFEPISREEIDALEGRELDAMFERAVLYREGREADSREEGVATEDKKEVDSEPEELTGKITMTKQVDDEGEFVEAKQGKVSAGQDVEYTARIDRSKHRTPGDKKKFIRREAEHRRRKETGQRSVKATPVRRSGTATNLKRKKGESEKDYNKRVARAEKSKKFDTAPLTTQNYKMDESVVSREEREANAKSAMKELGAAATRAKKSLRKFEGKTAASKVPDNIRTDFLYARNYLKQLIEFARSIQASKGDTNDTIKLARGVTEMLDSVEKLSTDAFATKWAKVARQNEFDDLANLKFTSLESLRVPSRRAKATTDTNSRRRNVTKQRAINEHLKQDQLYNRMVLPVLRKMTQYIEDTVNGRAVMPYIPNETEVAELKYAMQTLKNNWSPARLSDMGKDMQREFPEFATDKKINIYAPLRDQMEFVGFQFDENGNLDSFEASEAYLGARFNERFKGQSELSEADRLRSLSEYRRRVQSADAAPNIEVAPIDHLLRPQTTESQTVEEALANLKKRKKFLSGKIAKPPAAPRRDAPGLMTIDAINGLIDRFKSATSSSKVTIEGIKRQEARFIRGLKKLGVWRETAPGLGQIIIPGGTTKTYRMVTNRLESRKIMKNDARAAVQRMAKFPVPKAMLPDVRAARKSEDVASGLDEFLDENSTELFNEAAKPTQYDAEYVGVAERIGDMMMEGPVSATDALNTILEIAPQNSFYRNLAIQLGQQDLSGVEVVFGDKGDFRHGVLGKFDRSGIIYLNREALQMHNLHGDQVYGARVVHTLTHEMVHAVTHRAIDNKPALRQYFEALQIRGREAWRQNVGTQLPYGLRVLSKSSDQAHEFIAEAFSNQDFAVFLKQTPVETDSRFSLWRALVRAVRSILNLPEQAPNNIFDAIMLTEDVLFDDAGIGGARQGELYMTGDSVLDAVSTHVQDLAQGSRSFFDRLKNAARNLMTFEQLRDTYAKYFEGMKDGNGLLRYMDAFGRRNASVSRLMKAPEKLSTRWTEMEANNPEAAVEISRIGTEATVHRMTPAKQISAAERAKLTKERGEKYDELRRRFEALPPPAQKLYKDIVDWYGESARDEADLLLNAALRGVLTKGPGAVMTQEEFQNKFTDDVIAKMRDEQSITDELRDLVREEDLGGLVKELQRMASLRTLGAGDYFPLMRYGDFVVYAETKKPDEVFADRKDAYARRAELLNEDVQLEVGVFKEGNRWIVRAIDREFWMFERKSEAIAKRAELDGQYDKVSPVQARISRDTEETAISSNAALNSILTSLKGNPAAAAAIKNHYLRSLSDKSFRKRELKRKGVKGADGDIQHRNLANYMKQSAYYRSQLRFGWRMAEALQDMVEYTRGRADTPEMSTEQLQQVVINLQYRDQMTHDPSELNKLVRKGVNLTQFMMLTSPSYWMINATQPWLVTAPIMGGKHGYGASYAALKDAFSAVKTPLTQEALQSWGGLKALSKKDRLRTAKAFNVVDQLFEHLKQNGRTEYIELIDELRDQNIIDINVLTELREIADGIENNLTTRVLDASRILAHITEVNNRVVTAIAAYQLEINAGATKDAAKKYAADMVSQTQFNYSTENKPPLFQSEGPLKWAGPLMFQFMQWPQHMYALLIRNTHAAVKGESKEVRAQARKSLIGLLGTHAAVGGAVGMALQPIKWAFGMVMFAFGDDDEPYTFANAINGRTFDNMVTETMTDLFGQKIGGAASRGLPTLIGTDLSARMSMGTLYFVDLRGDTAESITGSLMASFGGATLNQLMNWGNALGKVAQGDIYRGAEQAMPKIIRDVMRAGRYYNEGLVNNNGDTVLSTEDLSFGEVFLQGIGFQPDEVSRFYQGQAAIKGAQGYARDRRERLIRRFVEEGAGGDILREVLEFNRAYPSMRITRSTLVQGARSRTERENRYGRYGANIDEQEARDFERFGEPWQ